MKAQKIFLPILFLAMLWVGCVPMRVSTPTAIHEPSLASGLVHTKTSDPRMQTTFTAPTGRITVLAAASLTESFAEIGHRYEEQYPNVQVDFSFGGSQQLAQQIQQHAPADVFASASKKYMDAVIETGQVTAETQKVFVENKLVIVVPTGNPAGLESLEDLAKPGIKIVLAAREVPAGQYSLEYFAKTAADPAFGSVYEENVLKNVVSYEENVKAVLAKVVLGEADCGIVYLSDVTGTAKTQVEVIEIPDEFNTIAKYLIAALNSSNEPELAASFIEFILSPTGQGILAKYGFLPAGE